MKDIFIFFFINLFPFSDCRARKWSLLEVERLPTILDSSPVMFQHRVLFLSAVHTGWPHRLCWVSDLFKESEVTAFILLLTWTASKATKDRTNYDP